MSTASGNLSARRGPGAGIAFFRLLLALPGGCAAALQLVAPVAGCYALFDRRARRAAGWYLRHRFPGAGRFRLGMHAWRLMTAQGRALVLAAWIGRRGLPPIPRVTTPVGEALLHDSSRGVILLISHFGCWQAALAGVGSCGRPVTVLAQADLNARLDKRTLALREREAIRFLDAESGVDGGLFECLEALARGELVCLMGDRPAGPVVELPFLGGRRAFPLSPWWLAARSGAPVLPLWLALEGGTRMKFYFGEPIHPPQTVGRRPDPESVRRAAEPYLRRLTELAHDYPYEFFWFDS